MEIEIQKLRTELETLEKRIRFLKDADTNINLKHDLLRALYEDNQARLRFVGYVVDHLPPVAISGDYNDLTNLPPAQAQGEFVPMTHFAANYFFISALPNTNTPHLATDKVFFLTELDTYVEGSFSINYLYTSYVNFSTTMKVMFNETVIAERNITIAKYTSYNTVVDFKVFPTQKQNYFYFVIECDATNQAHVENVAITIKNAKNIFILNRDYRKTVVVYKNTYYITENTNRYNKYHILNANNFVFSNPQTPAFDYGSCQYTFPAVTYNATSISIDESIYHMLVRDFSYLGVKVVKVFTTGILSAFQFQGYGHGFTYFRHGFSTAKMPTITGVFDTAGKLGYLFGNTYINRTDYIEYTLNGQPLEYGCWVENIPVTALDMTNAPANVFQGSVAVRSDGQCFYYNHYNATYVLPLGFGRMPSCYWQPNGNIHVYLGKINCVNKIVLVKNATSGQYEIDSTQTIWGAEQYYETLDGKAITITDGQISLIDA